MRQRHSLLLILVAAMSFGLISCKGYEAVQSNLDVGSSGLGGGNPIDTNVNMEALNKNLDEVDLSVVDIETELNKIDIPLLTAGDTSNGTQEGIDKSLRKVFEKLVVAAEGAFAKVGALRTEINSRIARLDPNNPVHALALVKLNEVLAYLDKLETRLRETYHAMVAKIEGLVTGVDERIAKMDSKSPLTWAILIYWQKIKVVVLEYRERLLAISP